MILGRRALASTLLVVLFVPSARADPQPSGIAKIEWRDVFWGDRYGRLLHAEKPYRNGRLLEGEDIYLALDRPDLAEAYRKRQETKTGLGIASGILLAGTAIAAAIAVAAAHSSGGHTVPVAPLVGVGIGTILSG